MIESDPEIKSLGHTAIFYLPSLKLDRYSEQLDAELIREYQGFTKINQSIEGHYQMGSLIVKDDHVRYEVAFIGDKKMFKFLNLLKKVCRDIQEQSIYVTIGECAYLIQPQ